MKKYLFICLSLFTLISCRKDNISESDPLDTNDFRTNYVGDYEYEMITRYWNINFGESWDTTNTSGAIDVFQNGDLEDNLYVASETVDTMKTITIHFGGNHITSEVQNDVLVAKSGYHYCHQGYFAQDSIYFRVECLGGLGAGYDYFLRGVKL